MYTCFCVCLSFFSYLSKGRSPHSAVFMPLMDPWRSLDPTLRTTAECYGSLCCVYLMSYAVWEVLSISAPCSPPSQSWNLPLAKESKCHFQSSSNEFMSYIHFIWNAPKELFSEPPHYQRQGTHAETHWKKNNKVMWHTCVHRNTCTHTHTLINKHENPH